MSKNLLIEMYENLFDVDFNCVEAPDWRMLKEYGGSLTIEEFRDTFYKVEYSTTNNSIIDIPNQYSMNYLFEEKLKF